MFWLSFAAQQAASNSLKNIATLSFVQAFPFLWDGLSGEGSSWLQVESVRADVVKIGSGPMHNANGGPLI